VKYEIIFDDYTSIHDKVKTDCIVYVAVIIEQQQQQQQQREREEEEE
jgi:hypothetical protein